MFGVYVSLAASLRSAYRDVRDALVRPEGSSGYHQPTAEIEPISLVLTIAAAAVVCVLAAGVYAFASSSGLAGTLGLVRQTLGPALYGGSVGLATGLIARAAHLRDARTTGFIALAAQVLSFWLHWVAWATLVAPELGDDETVRALLVDPRELVRVARHALDQGTTMVLQWPVRGWLLLLAWIVEAVLALGSATFVALYVATRRPFCDRCRAWCTAPTIVLRVFTLDFAELRRRLDAHDLDYVAALPVVGAEAPISVRLDAQLCLRCRQTCTLSARVVGRRHDAHGAAHDDEHVLSRWLLVTRDELNRLASVGSTRRAAPVHHDDGRDDGVEHEDVVAADASNVGVRRWCAGLPSRGRRPLTDERCSELRAMASHDATVGTLVLLGIVATLLLAVGLLASGGEIGVVLLGSALLCLGGIAAFPAGFAVVERLGRARGIRADLVAAELEVFAGRPRAAGLDATEQRLANAGLFDASGQVEQEIEVLPRARLVLQAGGNRPASWIRATILEAASAPLASEAGVRALSAGEQAELRRLARTARKHALTLAVVGAVLGLLEIGSAIRVAQRADAAGGGAVGWVFTGFFATLPIAALSLAIWQRARARRYDADLALDTVQVAMVADGRGATMTVERLASAGMPWRRGAVPAPWRVADDA